MKSLVTAFFLAIVRFGLRMPSQMLLQITARCESFLAETALKWSCTGVRSLMHHQIRLVRKPLTTNFHRFSVPIKFTAASIIDSPIHITISYLSRNINTRTIVFLFLFREALVLKMRTDEKRPELREYNYRICLLFLKMAEDFGKK